MRYVIGSVSIVMFFIIILWIFSIKENFSDSVQSTGGSIDSFKESIDNVQVEAPSIKEIIDQTEEGFNTRE